MTLRCWDFPKVGQLLVDQPGGLAIPGIFLLMDMLLSMFCCFVSDYISIICGSVFIYFWF